MFPPTSAGCIFSAALRRKWPSWKPPEPMAAYAVSGYTSRRGLRENLRRHNGLANPQHPVAHRANVPRPADRQKLREQVCDLAKRRPRGISRCCIRHITVGWSGRIRTWHKSHQPMRDKQTSLTSRQQCHHLPTLSRVFPGRISLGRKPRCHHLPTLSRVFPGRISLGRRPSSHHPLRLTTFDLNQRASTQWLRVCLWPS
jgi:hypothetical protein